MRSISLRKVFPVNNNKRLLLQSALALAAAAAFSTGAIAQLLPQALETLNQRHPAIDVQVAVLTSRETLHRLAEGSLEIGLVALPQTAVKQLRIEPWRRDPVMAFLPARGQCPDVVTPAWLAAQPLILNDNTTRLSRLTSDWFASDGHQPVPRIQLNYNDAIKSLVAAGYGATLLPHEACTPLPDSRIAMRPLKPLLWRQLGIAHRDGDVERSTQHVLDVLWGLSSERADGVTR